MKITHDAKVNAWYIQLVKEIKKGEAYEQREMDDLSNKFTVIADYDKKGRLLGIEILENAA